MEFGFENDLPPNLLKSFTVLAFDLDQASE